MNVLEKSEKSLEYLKTSQGSTKLNEIQNAAGTLGRCLGALGCRPNYARQYVNLLHSSVPVLLSLASHEKAEIRVVGEEALDRAIVGGFAFHAYKTNIILQNQIEVNKNSRWVRATLNRICLGDCWLRPGVGKIRSQAQTLLPKLTQIVRQASDIQLIVEALESNLPRILNAFAEYCMDEELIDLTKSLYQHVNSNQPPVRRNAAICIAHLCSHREILFTQTLSKIFDKLWPYSSDNDIVLGWFGVIKSLFQINQMSNLADNEIFTVQDYLELYHLCINYIEKSTVSHNIQNGVMETLSVLLSQATGDFKRVLLEKPVKNVNLDFREKFKTHTRNVSSVSAITSVLSNLSNSMMDDLSSNFASELTFSGALHLGSLSQIQTPSLSVEDLTLQTPDTPESDMDININNTELTKCLSEKLEEIQMSVEDESPHEIIQHDNLLKVNIGSSNDEDIPLKYCARLLASKFLITGNKNGVIPDKNVRVSVKSSALTCLSEIISLYPQAMTVFLDKDADSKAHNYSGSTDLTDSKQDNINDFILERNVCYQDSLTDSLIRELLNKNVVDTPSSLISKKISKSDSLDLKSLKDIPSNILDSKPKDLGTSVLSGDSTNQNISNSVFTNSNMTTSNDPLSTGYPMTSSGDILSSSLDLEIKFDHFGESTNNLDLFKEIKDLDANKKEKKLLKRTDDNKIEVEVMDEKVDEVDYKQLKSDEIFEFQHMSEIFVVLEAHNDPQVRGLVRICIGNYIHSALDLSHGDYYRWKNFINLPNDVSANIAAEKLVDILLKGLSDEIHSCVNHTLTALTKVFISLSYSTHTNLLLNILNSLIVVENNPYWLCKVNLCKLYEKLPYQRFYILYPNSINKSGLILNTLYRLLCDQDQNVRSAACSTITSIISKIYPSRTKSATYLVTKLAKEESEKFNFDHKQLSLELVKDIFFSKDLPEHLKQSDIVPNMDNLHTIVSDLFGKLMESSCSVFSQGLLQALHSVCKKYKPWFHFSAYKNQAIVEFCLDSLDCTNGSVIIKTMLLDICTYMYPVEIHKIMQKKASTDIFERDLTSNKRWQHLGNEKCSLLAEKFLQVTLKMLNILVHLIEEINPNVHINKTGIALPGSPVRRKTQEPISRRNSSTNESDDKSLRKKSHVIATSLRANFAGHFFNEPMYMRLYENLKSTHCNHKVKIDQKSSIFNDFLTSVLECLGTQLELSTEHEFGAFTEEILYYLKILMPYRPEKSVFCITQLLKCLFSTNMLNQYKDFISINTDVIENKNNCFYNDVVLINQIKKSKMDVQSNSSGSQKMLLNVKNPWMVKERDFLIKLENFHRNKMDKKWSTNKKELERYIRLFEPVVIQSLKSYTMHNDIPLQCKVLSLLNQLLTLRVNYCMLDSDQIFIGFLLKQLDLIEQHEIPNCCDVVHSILLFLVQLSSSKHHSKQIIEIPKLIQLCDGLMASGSHSECIYALQPLVIKVFWQGGGTTPTLGRTQLQEAQATKEVLFYMMQKCMNDPKVLDLVSTVLILSQEHPESYYRWSELACDTLLNILGQRNLEICTRQCVRSLERVLDCIYRDVLFEQGRVEMLLKILFKNPPEQATTSNKHKLRYLSIIMVLLRKYLTLIPESEILLSINSLKASHVSPQSIFFNVKTDIDPLNVLNVNENCANLSSDVVLVRFLFKTVTYAILEIDSFNVDCMEVEETGHGLLYYVCVNIICHVKNMLHLTNGCLFPLTSKTAQSLLQNEQSGLNTGLYNPEENIPLDLLNLICLRSAQRMPLLTVHWSHLLIRLKFLEQKYWHSLLGYVRHLPLSSDRGESGMIEYSVLQIGCFMAYCEYFVENSLSEAVHLTWLLVNRMNILINYIHTPLVLELVNKVQVNASASGLLLQAVATRCQGCLRDEFALKTHKLLSNCHEKQSGPLIFFICRVIGSLEPSMAIRFANLAIQRLRQLKLLTSAEITGQLTKEDVQVALELLQRNKVHIRYSALVAELNSLASTIFDLSPLEVSQSRGVNAQNISTTKVDNDWLVKQVKSRCCETICNSVTKIEKQVELACLLSNLSNEDIMTVLSCPEFDKKILNSCFKVATDNFIKDFLNIISVYELRENEKSKARNSKEISKIQESISNNEHNILNSFKRSDSKESKSHFFIPMTENKLQNEEKLTKLDMSSTDSITQEINPPKLPYLFVNSLIILEKSLSEIIHLFPKQSRPLSQSENFDLNIDQTIDKYTRRCHQVFQDKLFYQEFVSIQSVLTGYLTSLHRLTCFFEDLDYDVTEKLSEIILPNSLAKNIAIFNVISLQYMSFLIKNKDVVESPIHADISFRGCPIETEKIVINNILGITLKNTSKALGFKNIWFELNTESQNNRVQSAISCLYAVSKYFLKNTKPLILNNYIKIQDGGPKSNMALTCDKLLTLIEFWEINFYGPKNILGDDILLECYRKPIESLIVSLSRLELVCHLMLIPPITWPNIEVNIKEIHKINLPLQALQDMDVLQPFLFRVNFIGWPTKKLFEEIWVGLLGALQGNGTHWAVTGISQLLISTLPRVRRNGTDVLRIMHLPRKYEEVSEGLQRMRNIIVGTSAYDKLFDNVNLERIPLLNDSEGDGYHYAQFNTEYLKLASEIIDEASARTVQSVKKVRQSTDIDVNSCLQFLMDAATQMLHPKAPTGLSARCALLSCVINISDLFTEIGPWCWLAQQLISLTAVEYKHLTQYSVASQNLLYGLSKCLSILDGFDGLTELSTVHQKLLKSLSSSYAPLRQAALQGCLLQLSGKAAQISCMSAQPNSYKELVNKLRDALNHYLNSSHRISVYEQSLYWSVLFTLVGVGHSELTHTAVDFLLAHPTHYCANLIVKGITSIIRLQVLPKDLKKSIIEKLMDNMKMYSERHAIQIIIVHFFTADSKLLSPRLTCDASNMDPDVLMNSMERITLLYKILKLATLKESKYIIAAALKYFLRETLPPAAILSRIVIEFVESCRETEKCELATLSVRNKLIQNSVINAEIVFEVFQTGLHQDQLPVLTGWIFEALCHLLSGKFSKNLLPYCLISLLISASSNKQIRNLAPLSFYILRRGFENLSQGEWKGVFKEFLSKSVSNLPFNDRRLLCTVALHSNFSEQQLEKIKELCEENDCLNDLLHCLNNS